MSKVQTESLSRQVNGPHFALPPTPSATPTTTPDLGALQASLEKIAQSSASHEEALSAYLHFAQTLTNAIDCAYAFRSSPDRKGVMTLGTSKLFSTKERKELLLHWSSEACVKASVQLNRFEQGNETIATLPVFEDGRPVEALTAALLVPRGKIEPFVVSLQLVATAMGAWYRKHRAVENAFAARTSSAIIELIANATKQPTSTKPSLLSRTRCSASFNAKPLPLRFAMAAADGSRSEPSPAAEPLTKRAKLSVDLPKRPQSHLIVKP